MYRLPEEALAAQLLKLKKSIKKVAGKRAAASGLLVCRVPKQRPLPAGHVAMPWQEFPAWLEAKLR